MAKYGSGSAAFLLVDSFSLLADGITTLTGPAIETVLEDTTSLGDTWKQLLPVGLRSATLMQDGYFNDAATGANAMLAGLGDTQRILSVGVEGNTVGKTCVGMAGVFGAKYERIAERGTLTRAKVTYTVTGQVDEGCVILAQLIALTADTNTEGAGSQDFGASSANGAVGYLHVTAFSGFSSAVCKFRHSTDDVTYGDLITMTTVTGVTQQRSTVAGTVNRHTAVDINVTGTGSITLMMALKRL